MRKIALLVLLSFAACATADAATAGHGSSVSQVWRLPTQEWRLPSGMAPSQAEYQIFVAACKNKVAGAKDGDKIGACLSNEFGLQRIP